MWKHKSKTQNSQDSHELEEQNWQHYTTWFQSVLQSDSN